MFAKTTRLRSTLISLAFLLAIVALTKKRVSAAVAFTRFCYGTSLFAEN